MLATNAVVPLAQTLDLERERIWGSNAAKLLVSLTQQFPVRAQNALINHPDTASYVHVC